MFISFILRSHVPDNVVLCCDCPKASTPDELYVLQESKVHGCVMDEFDRHDGLALISPWPQLPSKILDSLRSYSFLVDAEIQIII